MEQLKKNIIAIAYLLAILPVIFLTGCNSDGPVIEQPEKIYYDLAQRRMKANNFFLPLSPFRQLSPGIHLVGMLSKLNLS